eukprot:14055381-Alexandrium_andersonii.AAC.1
MPTSGARSRRTPRRNAGMQLGAPAAAITTFPASTARRAPTASFASSPPSSSRLGAHLLTPTARC